MTQATEAPARDRARIAERTLRKDPWWRQPAINATALAVVVVYLTWASLVNGNYFWKPYISPLYSPCLATTCTPGCYYYRKAYYRAFWRAPAACAVREPHAKYTGETRFPLILQNLHRYFFWIAIAFNVILSIDAVTAFRNHSGQWGHMGLGTLILIANATLLWAYSLSCHACRHAVGGRLKHFSKHPVRYWMWTQVSKLNAKHMQFAWISLGWVLFTDLYIRLVASGAISDPRFF